MQLGLSLERLTLPDLVDEELGVRMGRFFLEEMRDDRWLTSDGAASLAQRLRTATYHARASTRERGRMRRSTATGTGRRSTSRR